MPGPLETFPLGGSGLRVSRLGLGTAPLGNLFTKVQEPDADATVDAALGAGITFVDTAPHGLGVAERRLARRLAQVPRDRFVLSTKVGRLVRPLEAGEMADPEVRGHPGGQARMDFSRDGVRRSLEESLERLGLDRVDVALVHDPDNHEREAAEQALPALDELRDQGVVRAIGAGMNQAEMLTRFVRELDLDLVLMAGRYSLLDQGALAELLPACVERGVAVVIGGVFNSGLLADLARATFDYAPAAELVERGRPSPGGLRQARGAVAGGRPGLPVRPPGGGQRARRRPHGRRGAGRRGHGGPAGPAGSGPSWSPKACARPSPVPTS